MNIPRKILKQMLSQLSRWAIAKHKIEVIVVAGFTGSEVVREGIYQILKEKFIIRRNIERISWDMSIPLAVLGYEDKRRNLLEWILLIVRAFGAIISNRPNPHTLVLSANCKFSDTAKFWSSFLSPDYFVALSGPDQSDIVKNILKGLSPEKATLIYDIEKFSESDLKYYQLENLFAFGRKGSGAEIEYDTKTGKLVYKDKEVKIPTITPLFTYSFIAAVFLTVIKHKLTFEEASVEAIKFDLGMFLTKRIKSSIERSSR
ncbi:hypothetical protein GF389_01460 [Candidatus Dojkabacteria bacterium]|nr:hypothetical protein [Candidatus Dojkabacteria bacterium]